MKVILEIDNDEDVKIVEKLLKFLPPSVIKTKTNGIDRAKKVTDFLAFVDNEAIPVEQIIIPSREERNAR